VELGELLTEREMGRPDADEEDRKDAEVEEGGGYVKREVSLPWREVKEAWRESLAEKAETGVRAVGVVLVVVGPDKPESESVGILTVNDLSETSDEREEREEREEEDDKEDEEDEEEEEDGRTEDKLV
jgi:hypothetical protein